MVSVVFKFCDDEQLPLVDLSDFIRVLQYVSDEGKASFEQAYGKISTTSTGTILRKVIELQHQGGDLFFGETSFDIDDLMRMNSDGRGMISILRVIDLMDRPKLFSTFMLSLLAELYAGLPEAGDEDRPKLVIFIDDRDHHKIDSIQRSRNLFLHSKPTGCPRSYFKSTGFKNPTRASCIYSQRSKDHQRSSGKLPRNRIL